MSNNIYIGLSEREDQPRVFLGGTCMESKWRDRLIPELKIDYFNPVVDDWNEEAQKKEKEAKETCSIMLFVITPRMTGAYSIHELTYYTTVHKDKTTVFMLMNEVYEDSDSYPKDNMPREWTQGQYRSFKSIVEDLKPYDNFVNLFDFDNHPNTYQEAIDVLAKYLNTKREEK